MGLGLSFFVFLNFLPEDNSPYTETPLDFLATEAEDIGQDIVFFPGLVEEEFSKSEVMAKGGEELMHAQTATPVKGPVEAQSQTLVVPLVEDLQQSATPSSETFKHLSTVDTVELVEQASLNIDHKEFHVLPTSSYQEIATEEVVASSTVPPTTDGTTLATSETSGHHPSATANLHMWGPNASPATEDDQLFSGSSVVAQEGDLPVVQEDHTTPFPSEPTTEPKPVLSSASQHVNLEAEGGDGSGIDEDTSAPTFLTYNEEPDVHSITMTPPVLHSLHHEGSGNDGENHDGTIESSTNNCVDVEDLSFSFGKLVPTAVDSSTAGE